MCGLDIGIIRLSSIGYKPRFPVWNYPSNHHYMIYEQLEVLHLQVSVVFKCLKGFSVHTIMIEKYISSIHWKIAVECYLKMSKWFQTYLQKRWMRFFTNRFLFYWNSFKTYTGDVCFYSARILSLSLLNTLFLRIEMYINCLYYYKN